MTASFAICFLLIEIVLRVAGVAFPVFVTTDDQLGMALRPGVSGRFTREGDAWVAINSHGWRDLERKQQKPTGSYRIAVLGDSYTEAMQVDREQGFVAQLEKNLASCPKLASKNVEVLNFGVGGFGTAQQYLAMRHHAWRFQPDHVLLAFLTGNDVADNSRALDQDPNVPYFELKDGRLALDDSFLNAPSFRAKRELMHNPLAVFLLDNVRLVQLVNHVRYVLKARRRATRAAGRNQDDPSSAQGVEAGLSALVYAAPRNADWEDAWAVTEALIEAMHEENQHRGIGFSVVTLSNGVQVLPGAEERQPFLRQHGLEDLFYPERRIAQLGQAGGFAVLNLAPLMQDLADEERVYFHGFSNTKLGEGHWNPAGHKTAAQLMAKHFCDNLPEGQPH